MGVALATAGSRCLAADPPAGNHAVSALARLAGMAVALPLLISPVSQLAPPGMAAKLPMAFDVAVLLVLLVRWALAGFRPEPVRPLLWLALAMIHAVLTSLWAIDQRICLIYGVRALHWALWAFGLHAAIRNRSDLVSVLRILHAAGCVSAAMGIAQWALPSLQVDFSRENTEGAAGAALVWESELRAGSIVRVTGTMAHPLGLALLLNFTLSWTPALRRAARTPLGRALVLASAAVQVAGLGLTYSRMAVLALVLGTVLYVVRGGVRRPGATLALLAVAGFAALPFLPATLVERVLDPTHFRESESLTARMEMQLYGSDIALEHGLLGVGYGCYGPAYEATAKGMYVEQARWMLNNEDWSSYDLGDIGAHNTFLEVWAEQGVPGLVLVGGLLASLVFGMIRANRALPRGSAARDLGLCCEAGFVSLLVTTLVLHVQEASIPWLWIGLTAAWMRLAREEAPEAA